VNELYEPGTGTFTPTGPPTEHRIFHAACLTKIGSVLLAGGGPARAEQFFPSTGGHADAGSCAASGLPEIVGPFHASLTLVPGGGRVVLVGGLVPGVGGGGSDLVLDQVQVWDPASSGGTGGFYQMLFDLKVPRAAHTVTPLPNGGHLLAGGLGTDGVANERRLTIFLPTQ
jgi:hypothetical protein